MTSVFLSIEYHTVIKQCFLLQAGGSCPQLDVMWSDLLGSYLNKRNAPAVIWTAVFLACALYFWLSRLLREPATGNSRSCSKPRVSVHLNRTLFRVDSWEVNKEAVAPFLELCATCDVFVFALAQDDASEKKAVCALEDIRAFGAGLRRHRVMFSSTDVGRASMVRQLQPSLHIEASTEASESLAGKVCEVRLVGSDAWPTFCDAARFDRALS